MKKIKEELYEEIKTFLKFIERTYWSDSMTSTIACELRKELK